ncbi:MAG: cation-translocating P-type ATPase C-terminal domain-containing protein, partial [Anaerovorax sp.]|nr:cation-translocating P-type ATPase C-terminal domain-containing protein [Anaerovorax sp.]
DSGDEDVMKEAPRQPKESLFAHGGLALTIFYGVVIGFLTLSAFLFVPIETLILQGSSVTYTAVKEILSNPLIYIKSQTYAFTILSISQLFHAIGMRNVKKSIFRINHLANRMMIIAFVVGFTLQIAVTEISFLTNLFGTVALSLREWCILTGLATVPLWFHELFVLFGYLKKKTI